MSKALVNKLIQEFLTDSKYKRRWDTVLRSHMGGQNPHVTTITRESLLVLYRDNTIAALYSDRSFTEAQEAAKNVKGIEEAAEYAANHVFENFIGEYAKTTGKRKGTATMDGDSIVVVQPAGHHSSVKRLIVNRGFSAVQDSGKLSANATKKFQQGKKRFNRGTQDLHEELTTVGSFTLATLYGKLLATTVESDFSLAQTTKIAKTIEELFGAILGEWNKSTTISEFEINDKLEIGLTIGPSSLNPAGSENNDWKQIRGRLEDALKQAAESGDFGEEYMGVGGSKPLTQQALERSVHIVAKQLKDKNKNLQITIKLPKEDKNKKYRAKVKQQKGKSLKKAAGVIAAKNYPKGDIGKKTKANQSPVNLMALINAKLPQTVASNMGAPALENRTGTFASSVRVTDIAPTAKGYPSIGYTYQKNPYSVFERTSGTRFASAERDPRTLIDLSIREIAQQLVAGRFYTRRV
tara:strand:- start:841 stop:2238 length:1398 start_codon:yes stop_codon:yes gene_type:complete